MKDLDLTLTGFDAGELDKMMKSLDARPKKEKAEKFDLNVALEEARHLARVKAGEVWQLGEHALICGDASDMETVERLLGGRKALMVFTDPLNKRKGSRRASGFDMPTSARG